MLNAINNFLTLTIKVYDYSAIADNAEFIRGLRALTLDSLSGMNYELNNFARLHREGRQVNAKIITASRNEEMVGWAFVSKEPSLFMFSNSEGGFDPLDGGLFQVYVRPSNRRQGIASELLKTANKLQAGDRLCVCPWDETSDYFYRKHEQLNAKII